MASEIIHDLTTPLTAIKMISRHITGDLKINETQIDLYEKHVDR